MRPTSYDGGADSHGATVKSDYKQIKQLPDAIALPAKVGAHPTPFETFQKSDLGNGLQVNDVHSDC